MEIFCRQTLKSYRNILIRLDYVMKTYLSPLNLTNDDLKNKEIHEHIKSNLYRTLLIHPSKRWRLCVDILSNEEINDYKTFWEKHRKPTEVIYYR